MLDIKCNINILDDLLYSDFNEIYIYVAVQRNMTDYQIYLYCILFKNIYRIYGNITRNFISQIMSQNNFPYSKNSIMRSFIS